MYFKGEPLYPFGFGLSYTTFDYANLKLNSSSVSATGTINVELDLKNTGRRDGEEVVQLYVKYLDSKIARPLRELKGFKRLLVRARQTRRINLAIPAQRLAYWNTEQHRFVVEPGKVEIMIGSSSADNRLAKIVEVKDK
jgi:beta-glucosidase